MEFELTADAATVAGIGRLKSLSSSRNGRPRSHAVKIVWHDSPEHLLLADGLALSEQRGVWRLERMVPGAETWLPAQPAPIVAEAPDQTTLPSPLAPLAAFEGRRTSSVHRFGEASVTLTIESGILRAVTAERPVARILLSGEEAAVHAAALLLAHAVQVAVPLASFAAEAIALATGRPAAPRHLGAPLLPAVVTSVPDALAHIFGHLTDVMLAHAPLAAAGVDDAGTEAIHQMRVAVRRTRSALSVFRPALQTGVLDDVGSSLKTLGGQLGPSRDWDVFATETVPGIQDALPGDPRLDRLAAAAGRRRRECRSGLAVYLAGAEFRKLSIELAWFSAAASWHAAPEEEPLPLTGFAAVVLQHRWKKLVSAGKRMRELDISGLHAVRLRAKRARYAAEMFATLFNSKAAERFIRRLSVLQQRLGVLNDGAVATHLLQELGGAGGRHAYAAGVVAGFMAARSKKMRPRILVAFEKFRRQSAFWA
jgi:CHAD domain-containing protein